MTFILQRFSLLLGKDKFYHSTISTFFLFLIRNMCGNDRHIIILNTRAQNKQPRDQPPQFQENVKLAYELRISKNTFAEHRINYTKNYISNQNTQTQKNREIGEAPPCAVRICNCTCSSKETLITSNSKKNLQYDIPICSINISTTKKTSQNSWPYHQIKNQMTNGTHSQALEIWVKIWAVTHLGIQMGKTPRLVHIWISIGDEFLMILPKI